MSYTVGSSGMIMKSGCDTGMTVNNAGKIFKNGSETGYIISGGIIIKESDKGYSIDWMFN